MYVSIDIDLSELDTDDLVEELCTRLKKDYGRKALSQADKATLKETLESINEQIGIIPSNIFEIKTLDDEMKFNHFAKVAHKYTVAQIENILT